MNLGSVKQMLEHENELHEEALKKNRELIACVEDYLGGCTSVEDFTADLRRIQVLSTLRQVGRISSGRRSSSIRRKLDSTKNPYLSIASERKKSSTGCMGPKRIATRVLETWLYTMDCNRRVVWKQLSRRGQ